MIELYYIIKYYYDPTTIWQSNLPCNIIVTEKNQLILNVE